MITIVIVTFKSEHLIDQCISSINQDFKIIVVENSDNAKIKFYLESKYKNVKCILSGSNLGFGTANNIGIINSDTDYVLILNPDAILYPDTLDILEHHVKNEDFAILAPHITNENENSYENFDRDENIKILNNQKNDDLVKVNSVRGFAMLVNKKKFHNNYFDENFFLYMEEIDLCKRAKDENHNLFISKRARVQHLGGQSHNPELNLELEISRNWHWMWSRFYFVKKHQGLLIALIKNFKVLLFAPFRIFFYYIIFNKKKTKIYCARLSGLLNSIMGKKSFYRPKV